MKTAVGYALGSCLAGGALGAGLSFAYQAYVAPADLPLGAGLGALAAGLAGFVAALRRGDPPPPSTRPPRDHDLRARLSPRFRWEATTRGLRRLLGRTRTELHGQPVFTALHPEDIHRLDQALQGIRADGRPRTLRCRFLPREQTSAAHQANGASDTQLLPPLDPGTFIYLRVRVRPRPGGGFACRFADDASALRRTE